ncbi:hypothetical protein ACQ4PT_002137 [Festuca glaucescens]
MPHLRSKPTPESSTYSTMPAANSTTAVTAWEIPTHGRPGFKGDGREIPAAATAVRVATPPPSTPSRSSRATTSRASSTLYFPPPDPEISYFARRFAYAYITPDNAPARANDPRAFVRAVFRTLAPNLPQDFELETPSYHGDVIVCFRTPDDREAAIRRQPFELAEGVTLRLVREGETPNVTVTPMDCLAHVALRRYPVEQRTDEEIRANCYHLGHLLELDPSCFAAPDLATVFVVLQLEQPRQIPRELRITYGDGSTSVVPVEILRVWDRSESLDGNGEYACLFQQSPAAAA